ncbi:Zn-dependent exopeptidase [Exidia glandulosa HHB12029]|uniref:Peptide hydrolase n=1 Tax=Exidia glandulosa HHB12029 TaxID=1314781 RepID=A0A165LKF1_EXIGL|nr:Zn-dependent exopeptidase [Exidia glandulosa HHB12029]
MFVLAPLLLAAATVVVASDERLIRYGPGVDDTARVSEAALDFIRTTPSIDASHPALAGVDPSFLAALASRPQKTGPGFLDLTEVTLPDLDGNTLSLETPTEPLVAFADAPYPTPNATKYPELASLFPQVSAQGLGWTIGNLTNFTTRYYRSTIARDSAVWIQGQFAASAGASNVVFIENSFNQPNVIAAIPRANTSTNNEVVIIGAHFDSLNQRNTSGVAPGADDDASGVAVILQTLQILSKAGFRGQRRIEFHAYAGEEGGLLGSTRTAANYSSAGTAVRGMVEFEMVAYQSGTSPVISLTTDTAPTLQTFVTSIIKTYVPEVTFRTTACGYGCSDHDSWVDQGYSAVCLAEAGPRDSTLNPYYHTSNDTLDKLNMTQASYFVKAALAFVVELSEHAA